MISARAGVEPAALAAGSDRIQPQPMFAILEAAERLRLRGREVIHLEIGDTKGFDNVVIRDALRRHAHHHADLGYSPSAGTYALREVVAGVYRDEKGVDYNSANVVIGPANSFILQVLAVTAAPGDRVLLPDPGFPTYRLAAEYLGLDVLDYPLLSSNDWDPDPDAVIAAMDAEPRPRAIIINTPSNPLGVAHDGEVVRAIAEAAVARGVHCLIDETYKRLVFGREGHHLPRLPPETLYLYSLSKDAAAPGLRIGMLVGPEVVAAKLADYASLLHSCSPPLFQAVAADYLEIGAPFADLMRPELEDRGRHAAAIMSVPGLRPTAPRAGMYVYVDVAGAELDGDQFAAALLERHDVCVCPGRGFGPSGSAYVRVSLGGLRAELEEGCRRMAAFAGELRAGATTLPT